MKEKFIYIYIEYSVMIFVCIKNINYINREPPFSSRALSELKTSFVNVSSSLSCIELFEVDDLMP